MIIIIMIKIVRIRIMITITIHFLSNDQRLWSRKRCKTTKKTFISNIISKQVKNIKSSSTEIKNASSYAHKSTCIYYF